MRLSGRPPNTLKVSSQEKNKKQTKLFIVAVQPEGWTVTFINYFLSGSPSGKIILNTKKKITIDTPPVINVTSRLYTAGGTYADAIGIHRLLNPLQIKEITIHAIKYHIA